MDYLTSPIPQYSGKRSWVKPVWDRLGNPDVYLEPCGGDLAVLLGRPHNPKLEVICDTSGLVSNFWRSIRNNPEGVALEADYPTIHQDLTARQKWLMEWAEENAERLSQDPEYFDTKAAGWWGWGACNWLGSGWCLTGNKKPPKAPNGSSQGIQAQRIELEGEIGTGERLMPWFKALARRLSRVVVLNQDWKAALTPTALQESRKKTGWWEYFWMGHWTRREARRQRKPGNGRGGSEKNTASHTPARREKSNPPGDGRQWQWSSGTSANRTAGKTGIWSSSPHPASCRSHPYSGRTSEPQDRKKKEGGEPMDPETDQKQKKLAAAARETGMADSGLSENAVKVLERRYLAKDKKGKVIETPSGMFRRVARNLSLAELGYGASEEIRSQVEEDFHQVISRLEFLPNSPTLMNAGRELQQLSACFVLPIDDSLDSIFSTVKQTALIHKSGGGTGFSFSRLRPAGDLVGSTGGVASGPVSFIGAFDATTEVVKAGMDLQEIRMDECNLRDARLDNGDLSFSQMRKANLRNASIRYVNLAGADLTDADLTLADLAESNLRGTQLDGASLALAKLEQTHLGRKNPA